MKVTVLVENTRRKDRIDLVAEAGLSLHITALKRRILFDAGCSDAFLKNSRQLGVSIKDVDIAVVSHHHYDHGNGMVHFLDHNKTAPLYLRDWSGETLSFRLFFLSQYIGLDKKLYRDFPDRLKLIQNRREIQPDIFLLTEITKKYSRPEGNRYLYEKRGGKHIRDRFEHELMMVVREPDGLVVFTGCGHSGLLNMIETVVTQFPGQTIKAVIGGFHLVGVPLYDSIGGNRKDIEALGRAILNYPVKKLYTGHCTGKKGFRILGSVLGDRLEYLPTGSSVEI